MPYLIEPDTHVDVTYQTEPWVPPSCDGPHTEPGAPASRLVILPGGVSRHFCDECVPHVAGEHITHHV